MKFWSFATVLLIGVFVGSKGLVIVNDHDPGQCDQSIHGQQVLVYDRENNEQVLICTTSDGVYQWRTVGGDKPLGEFFSPGFDCSDILDNNPKAENGMYWIHLGDSYPKQVWCDMITDGGGFMLVGRKNTSKTWSVPSSDVPVEPYGDPHWASNLGDTPILDFRIQIATSDDLAQTAAHWSLRLQSKRPLKKLMVDDNGCSLLSPGIGNIAYVKDMKTEKIVTTNFRCSVFGGYHYHHPGFGWHKMNSCLNKSCSSGYAYWEHPAGDIQVDFFGSFSFSATANNSGVIYDSTAFVGCSPNHICCGCYGPVGGTDNYCGHDCTAKNGGTVVKSNTYTWFWVRSSLPKRVWNRCMEYKERNKNGDMVAYKLLDGDTTPKKGNCPKDEALLNEGIVVVPDGKSAKKVPAIPGLLQYRKDNKELYVRSNETWKVIAPEKKILEKASEMVDPKFKRIEKNFQKQNQTVMKLLNSDIAQLKIRLNNNFTRLKTGLKGDITGMEQMIRSMNATLTNLLSIVKGPLTESVILSGESQYGDLLKLWLPGRIWNICWRATRDGWSANTFHANCDYKVRTVTVVKVGQYIFGGYATKSWGGGGGYIRAPGSFLFSLRNNENLPPFKALLSDQNSAYALYVSSGYGPTFGNHDLYISDNAGSNTNSFTSLSYQYQRPSGVSDTSTIFAGTHNFCPSEIEVFYLV